MKKRGRPIRDDGGRKDLQYRLRLSVEEKSILDLNMGSVKPKYCDVDCGCRRIYWTQ